ncbi:MAG: tetratricopeptide repeat protein [Thermoanaerobaculia bacterium]
MTESHAVTGAKLAVPALALACGLLISAVAAPVSAQPEESVPLREDVLQKLNGVQEAWIEWLTAVQEGDSARAERQIAALLSGARSVGMTRLPELAIAAAARGERFAREDDFTGAELSLAAAEELDPGRSETAFARATVQGLKGKRASRALWTLRGYARVVSEPLYRYVVLGDALLWLLAIATLLAAGVVAMQWTTRGVLLFRDLVRFFGRSVPIPIAYVLAVSLLLWPVFLPTGLLWLALYWSVLAWAYFERWEKLTIVAAWLIMGLAPLLVSEQIRRMNLDTTPQVRAMTNVAGGRLVGSLFQDLAPLGEELPDNGPVLHFMADLHLSIHQWDLARALYRQVLAAEPDNASAASDLGTCYFYEGDLDEAIRYLRLAVSLDTTLAAAHFNLSRALSEQYKFEESESVLRTASSLDAAAVSDWIRNVDRSDIVMAGGGFDRESEIRDQLASAWREQEANSDLFALWRRTVSLPLALVFVFPALLLYFIAHKGGNRSRRIDTTWLPEPFETVRRVFLPGFVEAEQGYWAGAVTALLIPVVLLAIPFWSRVAYGVPWVLVPPAVGLAFVPLIGLAIFMLVRAIRVLRGSRRGG